MSKYKFVVIIAVLSSLLFGIATLATASSSVPYDDIFSETPLSVDVIKHTVTIPRTPSGAIDWDAYTTYDRQTDTCCCSGYVETDEEKTDPDACKKCGGHRCPDCGDCIDCGTDPCPACCDDGRRCKRCRLCNPVTLSDTTHQYNGSAIAYTGVSFNSPVYAINYYYTALSGGAALNGGAPYRAGTYLVTAVFSSRAVSSGTLTATMTITPAPLGVLNVTVSNKVYDATSTASYIRGSESGFTLDGIFGTDKVELSDSGTPYFSSIYVDKAIPVNFVDFKISGEHAWNYYITHPTDVTADITPAPVNLTIELSEKIYDMTKNAVIKSVSKPLGLFDVDGVLDDVSVGKWGIGTYSSPYPDDAIPVTFSGFELVGEHAGNYYVDLSDKIGVIHQAPLTLKVIYDETKVYDTTVDVNIDDVVLDGMIPGDDIELDAFGELFYTSPDAGEDIPLEFTEFTIKGDSFDYYNITYPTSFTADITQAPLTVDVELFDKVYDGTTDAVLKSATLIGVLEDDDVELDELGVPTYDSPNAGKTVPVSFTDFTIKGEQTDNYYVIQPTGITSLVSRAPINISINDEDLKIGGVLDFTTSEDTDGWDIQWYADGELIPGANEATYTIRSEDVDKEISVKVVSPDGNREGEAAPTAPVPYTIILVISDTTEPMDPDNVYFGSPGNMTAYAANKNNGSVGISYSLNNSGYDFDLLDFSIGISAVTTPGSGSISYSPSPADAVNGIITITATFYHVGIIVEPTGAYSFSDIECTDSGADETHFVTVSQIGNYPAQNVSYSVSGAHPSAFKLDQTGRSSIGIDASDTFSIQVDVDNAPGITDGNTFSAVVNVSHDGVSVASIPVRININHDYSEFEYHEDEHYHDRTCKGEGCFKYSRGDCIYTPWRVEDDIHVRNCTVCLGRDTHEPDWNDWSQGNTSQHNRVCMHCPLIDNQNHAWGAWTLFNATQHRRECSVCHRFDFANHNWTNLNETNHRCSTCLFESAHTWGAWSAWSQGNVTNHTRTRTCTTAGCGRVDTQTAAHTWGGWTQGDGTNHTRTCTTCGRSNSAAHTWGAWSAWGQGTSSSHTRTRSCTTCGRGDSGSASHTWGSWTQGNATSHTRTCTACGRSSSANHSWGSWRLSNNTSHTRSCSVCGRSSSANHSWYYRYFNGTYCRQYCNTCSGWHSSLVTHTFVNMGVTGMKTCTRCSFITPALAVIDPVDPDPVDPDPVDPDDPDPVDPDPVDPDDPIDLDDPIDPVDPDEDDLDPLDDFDTCLCGCSYDCFDCDNCRNCNAVCKACDFCSGCRPKNYHCHDCCECNCDLTPPDAYKDPDDEPEPDPDPLLPPPIQPPITPIQPPIIPIQPPLILIPL